MPKLIFHDSDGIDRTIDLGAEPTLIGRASECQVQTQDALVSRRHARIVWDGGYWIEDLGSSNGVFVGGERVQRAPLRPGDEVRCGSLVMRLMPDVSRSRPSTSPPSGNLGPPPPAPPPMTPMTMDMPPAAPPPPEAPPARRASGAPTPAMAPPPAAAAATNGLLEEERARRMAAEDAVLTAEQRLATAENKLFEAETKVTEAEQRAAAASAQAERAVQFEQGARQADGYRRQIEQLRAEIRRLRGGAPDEITNADAAPSPVMVAELSSERDRLRQRVADLEAQVARGPALAATGGYPAVTGVGDDSALLRRRVDQLTAELRRIRGGGPATPLVDEGRVADLETRLARAEQERDEARRAATDAAAAAASRPAAAAVPDLAPEVDRMRRMIDQLNAENRRLRQGSAPTSPPDDPRIADLESRLARAEQERDALRKAPAVAAPAPAARGDAAVLEALGQVDDALADVRGSVRAANDEVGVLGVEAPSDSVHVLREALVAAGDQLETARGKAKEVRALLGGAR